MDEQHIGGTGIGVSTANTDRRIPRERCGRYRLNDVVSDASVDCRRLVLTSAPVLRPAESLKGLVRLKGRSFEH